MKPISISNYSPILYISGLTLLIGLLFYATFNLPAQLFAPEGINPITHLESAPNQNNNDKPPITLEWQPQTLPDDWWISHKINNDYWYRTNWHFDSAPTEVMAIYLPTVSHNVSVFINGTWIGDGGSFEKPIARNHNFPLLFSFSPELLNKGNNEVLLRVVAATHKQGLLDQFYLAPKENLKDAYQLKYFVRISVVKWLTVTMLVASVVLFFFWLYRRRDSTYGSYSFVLFFWGLYNLNIFTVEIPLPPQQWETLIVLTLGWTITAVIRFTYDFLGKKAPYILKILLTHSFLGLLLFFTPDLTSLIFWGYNVWHVSLMAVGVYIIVFLFVTFLKEKNLDAFWLLVAASIMVVFGAHDIVMVNHHMNRFDGLILQYSAIPTTLVFGWFLLRRFYDSLKAAENYTVTLEQTVKEKEEELKAQYLKLLELEKQQTLNDERERMMRDMHDGVGGNLISLLSLFKTQKGSIFRQAHQKVQTSITDLRLIIDSLDPLLGDVTTLLATMRSRFMSQLEDAEIELEWNIEDIPETQNYSPQHNLHIMRIVQEAITNCIKHSKAKRLSISTYLTAESKAVISIRDFGTGISEANNQSGHGVSNMQWRATQLNGELQIIAHSDGTEVQLILPNQKR